MTRSPASIHDTLSESQRCSLVRILKRLSGRTPVTVNATNTNSFSITDRAGGNALSAHGDVVSYACRAGLIETRGDNWRPSRAGIAWLRRRLSERDSFQDQHQVRTPIGKSADGTAIEINLTESPLGWLARRKDKSGRSLISRPQFEAGERLRSDYSFAQMTPNITSSWQQSNSGNSRRRGVPGHGVELSDRVIAAKTRVRYALDAVGPELAGILIDICCELKGLEETERANTWSRRSGKVVLGIALSSLARHYGLIKPDANQTGRGRSRTTSWGTEDYRPTLNRWRS